MKKNSFQKILLIIAIGFLLSAPAAMAAGILPAPTGDSGSCGTKYPGKNCGNYTLNDMLMVAINVSNWILGIVGSVALLFFVYGGLVFIFSGGNDEKVKEGKNILLGAVIGLVIVFASYTIIQFSMTALGVIKPGDSGWSNLSNFVKTLNSK